MDYFAEVKPIIDLSVRELCHKPYKGHPKGCPNFNKRWSCPPKCKTIDKLLDLSKPDYAIYNIFDFKSHVNRMKEKHPNWTQRQLECCLYWQPRARKELKNKIKLFLQNHQGYRISYVPEGQGVNITATMANVGIQLEWPPITKTFQIVLAGIPNKSE